MKIKTKNGKKCVHLFIRHVGVRRQIAVIRLPLVFMQDCCIVFVWDMQCITPWKNETIGGKWRYFFPISDILHLNIHSFNTKKLQGWGET